MKPFILAVVTITTLAVSAYIWDTIKRRRIDDSDHIAFTLQLILTIWGTWLLIYR